MPVPTDQLTGPVTCEPMHYPHMDAFGLVWCEPCRAWHHADYACPDAGRQIARRYDEPEGPAPECSDCDTEHLPGVTCPRAYCDDCDDWHDRDRWGDITCPGWYCEDCDEYHDYGEECPDPPYSGCDCEAPRRLFTVPNDGQPPLGSDERATVHLAAGVITDEGLAGIRSHLQRYAICHLSDDQYRAMIDVSYELHGLGNQWQTREGNYTKRLSRLAYKNHGIKVTPEVLSMVGTIAREHSTAADVDIDVTRDLNRPAKDFYSEDSCWWGSYSESRCAFKTNGGFGLRSFDGDGGVSGRAWVMPLRSEDGSLVPTFDTDSPDALVVFNGYGDLSGYAGARVIAAMYGMTYAKIEFDCEPMYINSGGYLVGPEDIVRETRSLHLSVEQHASIHERELENVS